MPFQNQCNKVCTYVAYNSLFSEREYRSQGSAAAAATAAVVQLLLPLSLHPDFNPYRTAPKPSGTN